MMTAISVHQQYKKLSRKDRLDFVRLLLDDDFVLQDDTETSAETLGELRKRSSDIKNGAKTHPFSEVKSYILQSNGY